MGGSPLIRDFIPLVPYSILNVLSGPKGELGRGSHCPSSNAAIFFLVTYLFDFGPIEERSLNQHVRVARIQALTLTAPVTTGLLGWQNLSRQMPGRRESPQNMGTTLLITKQPHVKGS